MRSVLLRLAIVALLTLAAAPANATPITWSFTGVMTTSTANNPGWTFPVGTEVTFTVDMDPHASNRCAGFPSGGLYDMTGGSYTVDGKRYTAARTFLEVNSPLGICGDPGITGYTLRFFDFDDPLGLASAFIGWPSGPGSDVPTILPLGGYFSVFGIGGNGFANASGDIIDVALVPEPMTLTLLTTGLGVIALRRRRAGRSLQREH